MDDFDHWNEVKKDLNRRISCPPFKEGEIWWYGAGMNVGVEINGKGKRYSRPVLILRKLSQFGFMGVPLTSQPHKGSWYAGFEFKGKFQTAVLAQAKTMSAFRLYNKIGLVPDSDLELVREGFEKLYCLKK